MNRRVPGIFFAAVLTLSASEPTSQVAKDVLQAEGEWKSAVLKSDSHALEMLLSADLSYTHSSGKTQTRDEFIHDATGGGTVYKSIDF